MTGRVGFRHRAWGAIGVAAIATGSLSSCAAGPAASTAAGSSADAVTSGEAPGALAAETADFPQPLPDGVSWPDELPRHLSSDRANMEPGVPRAMVSFYWLCAWEDAYLKASESGESNAQADSLDMVARFLELPFYAEHYDDPDRLWYNNVVVRARNGDDAGVRSDVAQCDYFYDTQ